MRPRRARGGAVRFLRPGRAARAEAFAELHGPALDAHGGSRVAVVAFFASLGAAVRRCRDDRLTVRLGRATRAASDRLGRNLGLFGLNALLSPALVLPVTAWAAARSTGLRPAALSGWAGLAVRRPAARPLALLRGTAPATSAVPVALPRGPPPRRDARRHDRPCASTRARSPSRRSPAPSRSWLLGIPFASVAAYEARCSRP